MSSQYGNQKRPPAIMSGVASDGSRRSVLLCCTKNLANPALLARITQAEYVLTPDFDGTYVPPTFRASFALMRRMIMSHAHGTAPGAIRYSHQNGR